MRTQIVAAKKLVGAIPDSGSATLVEEIVDLEISLQLEMGPMVKRVAERVRYRPSPGEKLLARRRIARAEAFLDAVGSHGAPFIMIAFKPDLEQIREPAVLRDVARREMAVIIEDRFGGRVVVIQTAGGLVG